MTQKIVDSSESLVQAALACDSQNPIQMATKTAMEALYDAHQQLETLALKRTQHKQSNSRVVNIAKELKELIKVLALV